MRHSTTTITPPPSLDALRYRRGFANHVRSESVEHLAAAYAVAVPDYDAGWFIAERREERNAETVRL